MKRLTIGYIREQFEKEKYKLLSTEYIDAHSKLEYICSKGHRHSIKWNHFKSGHGCPYCANNGKLTIGFIKQKFAVERYKLLTTIYKNARQKLNYICSKGHVHNISWYNWKLGKRCPYCSKYRNRYTIEFIRAGFEKEGYQLLTKKYINSIQKLEYICPNGHKHKISWHNWQQGQRCSYCANNIKLTIEFVKTQFEKRGYILQTEKYTNNYQKLYYSCPNGHKHSITWNNWKNGNRCPHCVGHISKGEKQVRRFVKSLGIEVSSNNRNQIFSPLTNYPLELDIFMPILNKAIEYNGEYWHQNKDVEARDLLKQQLCKEKGINLLTIWDNEWMVNNKRCKEKITGFIFNSKAKAREAL